MLELADIDASGAPMPSDIWDQCVEYALIEDAAAITAERMDISHGRTTF